MMIVVISEEEATVILCLTASVWRDGLGVPGDTQLARKLITYYPKLADIIQRELESREKDK